LRFLRYIAICVALCAGLCTCGPSRPNTVVAFLQGADQQWETQEQGREIEKALNDMLTLTPDELRKQRYANYQMQPGIWTVIELLHHYFAPQQPAHIDESTFYKDASNPAAHAVIRLHLEEVSKSIPLHPTIDSDEDDEQEEEEDGDE